MAQNANQREDRVPTPATVLAEPKPFAMGAVSRGEYTQEYAGAGKTVTAGKTAEELAAEAAEAARLKKLADDKKITPEMRDAFAIIKGIFLQYGLGDLGATI